MDERTLMDFITKIIANTKGNNEKTQNVLSELKNILESQNVDTRYTRIVEKALDAIPEIYDLRTDTNINSRDIETVYLRAEARRKREEEYRNQGRC